ncbi:MAG: SDR family NAD(P)-dependent oxidoreductase [Polyangiaceae bacterium]
MNPQPSALRGRVALVTGASAGIGAAVARRLLELGMRVAVCARRKDRLEALRADGGELLALACDLRDEAQILAMFRTLRETWGGVDVLVNNAGLGHLAPLCSGESDHWREMLEVNVLALSICTREAVADMRRRGDDGHVLHVSSMASHRVPPDSGMYSATKYAVRALTEALRQELRAQGSKIRVSALSPGFVETEFAAHYHKDPAAADRTYGRFKVLEAEDVAWLVETILTAPPHVQIHDLLVRPRDQQS